MGPRGSGPGALRRLVAGARGVSERPAAAPLRRRVTPQPRAPVAHSGPNLGFGSGR